MVIKSKRNRNKKHKKSKTYKKRKINKKNKKYNLKGGFLLQSVINIPYSENLPESINTALAPIFEILPTFSKDLVYISFGSKLNERTLESGYLHPDYTYANRVNAGYQMVPFFLCSNSGPRQHLLCEERPCRVLNIVIDMFNGEEDIENSKRYITESLTNKRELDESLETANITQYFVNITSVKDGIFQDMLSKGKNPYIADEHHIFLETLSYILCKKMRENGIIEKNFMLCNYIKFKSPNSSEDKIGKKASESFASVMKENGYENSYYEWFGYFPMMLYNCIASPKYITIFKTLFSSGTLMKDNIKNQMKILDISKSEFKNPKHLDLFKHIIPIKNTHFSDNPPTGYGEDRQNNFCYSVYDLIKE
jgi:hypothetical protein